MVVATGVVLLEVHSARTHNACRCNRLVGMSYSVALAALSEATEAEKTTDPSYGMFVMFVWTSQALSSLILGPSLQDGAAGGAGVHPDTLMHELEGNSRDTGIAKHGFVGARAWQPFPLHMAKIVNRCCCRVLHVGSSHAVLAIAAMAARHPDTAMSSPCSTCVERCRNSALPWTAHL